MITQNNTKELFEEKISSRHKLNIQLNCMTDMMEVYRESSGNVSEGMIQAHPT